MTIKEYLKRFPTEKAAIDYFLNLQYHGTIICPHCGKPVHYRYQKRAKIFHCYSCKNTFSPFKDTMWRMLQQIRIAMGNEDMSKAFHGLVQIDETYVGGKPRKINTILDEKGKVIYQGRTKNKRGRWYSYERD